MEDHDDFSAGMLGYEVGYENFDRGDDATNNPFDYTTSLWVSYERGYDRGRRAGYLNYCKENDYKGY